MRFVLFFIVQWFNTVIEVPVYEDINDYSNLPQVVYYENDGKKREDVTVRYSYDMLHDVDKVNTKKVGSYSTTLLATFSHDTKNIHKQTITYKIVDKVNPTINDIKEIRIPLKSKLPNPNEYIDYDDNYNDIADLKLKVIGYNQIKTDKIGSYPFTYEVTDKSGNKEVKDSHVIVYDNISPSVKQLKEMKFLYGDNILINDYFEIKDDYDEVLKIEYDIDTSRIGKFIGILRVSDQSNNETVNEFIYEVDRKIGEIEFRKKLLRLPIENYDNIDDILEENMTNRYSKIKHSEINYELGKQEVSFYETDHLGYECISKCTLEFYDDKAPTYKIVKKPVVRVNTLEPYIPDYIEVTDNFDKKISIKYTGKINMQQLNEYRIMIEIADQSKNSEIFPIVFSVIDDMSPVVINSEDIVVTDFKEPQFDKYLKITDNYDKTFIVKNKTVIDYTVIGKYDIELSVKDMSGNETLIFTTLEIKDLSIPKITLLNDEVHLGYKEVIEDYFIYIKSYEDDYDSLSIDNIVITNNIDYEKTGRYQIKYYIEDASKNHSEEIITVFIKDEIPPLISVNDYYKFKKSEVPHLLTLASAYDDYDKDVSHLMTFISPTIDKSGKYEVVYEAHDKSGNYTNKKIIIEIENDKNYKLIIIISVILTFFVILVYTILRSKKRKNFENSNNYIDNE